MKDYTSLPPHTRLRPGDPRRTDLVLAAFAGTYKSNWYFLRNAAKANLLEAASATARLVENYHGAVAQQQRPAEMWLLMCLNYSYSLSGPLVGTILATSAAVEAFLRLFMRAVFEREVPKRLRSVGTSPQLRDSMKSFDELKAFQKVAEAYKAVTGQSCPDTVRREFDYLAMFRNDCFHADPVLIDRRGRDETTKRGRVHPVRSRRPPEYPLLWDGNFPLALSHAMRAVDVHDVVVRDLLISRPEVLINDRLHDRDRESGLICHALPTEMTVDVLRRLGAAWDQEVLEGLEAVPTADKRAFVLELAREVNVQPVR